MASPTKMNLSTLDSTLATCSMCLVVLFENCGKLFFEVTGGRFGNRFQTVSRSASCEIGNHRKANSRFCRYAFLITWRVGRREEIDL